MKARRFLFSLCLGLAFLLCLTYLVGTIWNQQANGNPAQNAAISNLAVGTIPNGQPQFGSSSVNFSLTAGTQSSAPTASTLYNFGTNALITSGGTVGVAGALNSSSGTGNITCYGTYLAVTQLSGGTLTLGSGTASCSFPLYASSTGTTGNSYYSFPQILNVNQTWLKLATTSTSGVTADVELLYTQ